MYIVSIGDGDGATSFMDAGRVSFQAMVRQLPFSTALFSATEQQLLHLLVVARSKGRNPDAAGTRRSMVLARITAATPQRNDNGSPPDAVSWAGGRRNYGDYWLVQVSGYRYEVLARWVILWIASYKKHHLLVQKNGNDVITTRFSRFLS